MLSTTLLRDFLVKVPGVEPYKLHVSGFSVRFCTNLPFPRQETFQILYQLVSQQQQQQQQKRLLRKNPSNLGVDRATQTIGVTREIRQSGWLSP
jgi:hypothetical protein